MPDASGAAKVPLNIWLCPAGRAAGSAARYALAEQVISEYVPEGGTVLDLAPNGGEVVRAAQATHRSVVVAPASRPCAAAPLRPPRRLAEILSAVEPVDLALLLPPADRLTPPYRRFRSHPSSQRILFAAAASVVRPGGMVAVAFLGDPNGTVSAPEAAAGAGLSYFQHVVALLAPTDRPSLRSHVDVLVFVRRQS